MKHMSNEARINASALKWTKQKKKKKKKKENSLGKDEQIPGSIRYLLNIFSRWFNTVPHSKIVWKWSIYWYHTNLLIAISVTVLNYCSKKNTVKIFSKM